MELRPYQVQAVAELRDCYRRGARAPLYQLPTGGGKTVVFCHISEGATKRGKSVWIVVHRQELLYQCSRALEGLGVMHGLIAPGFTPGIEHVQVASVQTLVKRLDSGRAAPPDLIVLDEAHHATAGSWRKIIEACPNSRLLGVTATPVRLDGQGLGVAGGGVFDALVSGPTIPELIAQGFLSPPVVYAPPTQLDLSGVRMVGGDYAQGEIGRRMDKPTITGDVVAHYRRICNGAPAIAFCASVEHAKHVAADFRGAGFRAESLDGKMPDGQRKTLIDELGRGHLNVLTSCDIVSEGTDIPVVMAAILLRPTASMGLYLQQVGRALRPAPGKTRAVILDHVGNCLRHGLPDEDREWSLAGVVRRSREGNLAPLVKIQQCPQCYAAHAPGPRCPHCGYSYPQQLSAPDHVDGELSEVTADQAQEMRARRAKQFELGRARGRKELEQIARDRGYKAGWVTHMLEARARKTLEHIASHRGYGPDWVNLVMAARRARGIEGAINPYGTVEEWGGGPIAVGMLHPSLLPPPERETA